MKKMKKIIAFTIGISIFGVFLHYNNKNKKIKPKEGYIKIGMIDAMSFIVLDTTNAPDFKNSEFIYSIQEDHKIYFPTTDVVIFQKR